MPPLNQVSTIMIITLLYYYITITARPNKVKITCQIFKFANKHTRAVWKVHGLTLLLRVGTLWRCGDGLFFEIPPLASDALLTTLHPLLENVPQTVYRKLQEDSGTGGFNLGAPFSGLQKHRNRMGRDLDRVEDVLIRFHRSRWTHALPLINRATLTLH
jgi:hypothetical protein